MTTNPTNAPTPAAQGHTPGPSYLYLGPETVARVAVLYRKYVGAGPIDLDTLRGVIRREKRAAEKGFIQVSPGLLTELRSELAEVGRYQNEARAAIAKAEGRAS